MSSTNDTSAVDYPPSSLAVGVTLAVVTFGLLLLNVIVSVGVFRSAKKNAPFVLIAAQSVADTWKLLQYLWFAIEICFQAGSIVSHRIEFLLYGLGQFVGDALYIAIAVSRLHMIICPTKSMTFWSTERTMTLAVCAVVVGLAYDIFCSFAFDIPDEEFLGHKHSEFSFSTIARTGLAEGYRSAVMWGNMGTIAVALAAYTVMFAYSLWKRKEGTSKAFQSALWKSAEFRLTLTCLLNFLPVALGTLLQRMKLYRWEYYDIMKTCFGILNGTTNAWLLLMFSPTTRNNIPLKLWRKSTAVEVSTNTSNRVVAQKASELPGVNTPTSSAYRI